MIVFLFLFIYAKPCLYTSNLFTLCIFRENVYFSKYCFLIQVCKYANSWKKKLDHKYEVLRSFSKGIQAWYLPRADFRTLSSGFISLPLGLALLVTMTENSTTDIILLAVPKFVLVSPTAPLLLTMYKTKVIGELRTANLVLRITWKPL